MYVSLMNFFDRKGTMSTIQCGGRAKQTTIDHILPLETTVRKAQENGEQVVSINIDM